MQKTNNISQNWMNQDFKEQKMIKKLPAIPMPRNTTSVNTPQVASLSQPRLKYPQQKSSHRLSNNERMNSDLQLEDYPVTTQRRKQKKKNYNKSTTQLLVRSLKNTENNFKQKSPQKRHPENKLSHDSRNSLQKLHKKLTMSQQKTLELLNRTQAFQKKTVSSRDIDYVADNTSPPPLMVDDIFRIHRDSSSKVNRIDNTDINNHLSNENERKTVFMVLPKTQQNKQLQHQLRLIKNLQNNTTTSSFAERNTENEQHRQKQEYSQTQNKRESFLRSTYAITQKDAAFNGDRENHLRNSSSTLRQIDDKRLSLQNYNDKYTARCYPPVNNSLQNKTFVQRSSSCMQKSQNQFEYKQANLQDQLELHLMEQNGKNNNQLSENLETEYDDSKNQDQVEYYFKNSHLKNGQGSTPDFETADNQNNNQQEQINNNITRSTQNSKVGFTMQGNESVTSTVIKGSKSKDQQQQQQQQQNLPFLKQSITYGGHSSLGHHSNNYEAGQGIQVHRKFTKSDNMKQKISSSVYSVKSRQKNQLNSSLIYDRETFSNVKPIGRQQNNRESEMLARNSSSQNMHQASGMLIVKPKWNQKQENQYENSQQEVKKQSIGSLLLTDETPRSQVVTTKENLHSMSVKLKHEMTLPANFYQEQAELKLPDLTLNLRPPQIESKQKAESKLYKRKRQNRENYMEDYTITETDKNHQTYNAASRDITAILPSVSRTAQENKDLTSLEGVAGLPLYEDSASEESKVEGLLKKMTQQNNIKKLRIGNEQVKASIQKSKDGGVDFNEDQDYHISIGVDIKRISPRKSKKTLPILRQTRDSAMSIYTAAQPLKNTKQFNASLTSVIKKQKPTIQRTLSKALLNGAYKRNKITNTHISRNIPPQLSMNGPLSSVQNVLKGDLKEDCDSDSAVVFNNSLMVTLESNKQFDKVVGNPIVSQLMVSESTPPKQSRQEQRSLGGPRVPKTTVAAAPLIKSTILLALPYQDGEENTKKNKRASQSPSQYTSLKSIDIQEKNKPLYGGKQAGRTIEISSSVLTKKSSLTQQEHQQPDDAQEKQQQTLEPMGRQANQSQLSQMNSSNQQDLSASQSMRKSKQQLQHVRELNSRTANSKSTGTSKLSNKNNKSLTHLNLKNITKPVLVEQFSGTPNLEKKKQSENKSTFITIKPTNNNQKVENSRYQQKQTPSVLRANLNQTLVTAPVAVDQTHRSKKPTEDNSNTFLSKTQKIPRNKTSDTSKNAVKEKEDLLVVLPAIKMVKKSCQQSQSTEQVAIQKPSLEERKVTKVVEPDTSTSGRVADNAKKIKTSIKQPVSLSSKRVITKRRKSADRRSQQDHNNSRLQQNKDDKQERFSLSQFTVLRTLGKGAFGEVMLVNRNVLSKTGRVTTTDYEEFYALKKIAKNKIRGDKHIQHVMNERNIMRELASKGVEDEQQGSNQERKSFFCKLIHTMQDESHLYLLLEYLPGGELLQQIKQHLSLTMADSVFYLAEILIAIKQLHERNIIYRDLKPENILLDSEGHIKLIDFGFAKQLQDLRSNRARTNCGTPAYAAPEVLIGAGYNYKADIWSFGILICEMLGGFTPFGPKAIEIGAAQNDARPAQGWSSMPPSQIVEMANSGRIILPKNLNSVTRDLVKRILVADPEVRLEIRDIMQHRFFADVNWTQVQEKQTTPPYNPPCESIEEERKISFTSNYNDSKEYNNNNNTVSQESFENQYNPQASVKKSQQLLQQQTQLKSGQSAMAQLSPNKQNSASSLSPTKRGSPNGKMILGDYHITKVNQVFENF